MSMIENRHGKLLAVYKRWYGHPASERYTENAECLGCGAQGGADSKDAEITHATDCPPDHHLVVLPKAHSVWLKTVIEGVVDSERVVDVDTARAVLARLGRS